MGMIRFDVSVSMPKAFLDMYGGDSEDLKDKLLAAIVKLRKFGVRVDVLAWPEKKKA